MLKLHGFLLVFLPLTATGAQSLASVTETRLIQETGGGKPDTLIMKTTTSAGRTRIDVSGSGTHAAPWASLGTSQIMIHSDSGYTITYLDSVKKTYWTVNMRSMFANIQKTIGLDMAPAAAGDTLAIDSLGVGESVMGHPTVHFRAHSVSVMHLNMLGDPTTLTTVQTTDYYVAPGVHLDSLEKTQGPSVPNPPMPLIGSASNGMKALVAQHATAAKRMSKIGSVLKSVTQSATTVPGGTRTQRSTTEVLSYRADS
ncbi:MAG: hypothetical protein ABI229_00195, partial [Gemmatimonadaceae bacterium]